MESDGTENVAVSPRTSFDKNSLLEFVRILVLKKVPLMKRHFFSRSKQCHLPLPPPPKNSSSGIERLMSFMQDTPDTKNVRSVPLLLGAFNQEEIFGQIRHTLMTSQKNARCAQYDRLLPQPGLFSPHCCPHATPEGEEHCATGDRTRWQPSGGS